MTIRESYIFLVLMLLLSFISITFLIHNSILTNEENVNLKRMFVKRYGLTDLAVFTDARYTRHISQSDFFSPFQENPSSLDMFTSASFVLPPNLFGEKDSESSNN